MLAGYYNKYRDEDGKYSGSVSKTMKFVISDNLVDNINDIFNHIGEKLDFALQEWFHKSEFNYYLKTKIYKITCFSKKVFEDDHKNTKYECKPLLQIRSFIMFKKIKKHIFCYPQMRLEQVGYKDFIEYNIAYKDFMFTDRDPELEKAFNDDNDNLDE